MEGGKGQLVLVIMDGVGLGKYKEGAAVLDSKMYNSKMYNLAGN
jgi:2,3-bisphosphoglycerate-independent phosphoglycerate mutase